VLNDKVKRHLKLGNFSVIISLDSVDKANYENIRKNADFETTMNNISWFGKNTVNLGIMATPFRQNWKDIPDIVEYCNKNNYRLYFSPVFHPKELALWSWDVETLDKIIQFYASTDLPRKNSIQKHNSHIFSELLNTVKHWRIQKSSDINFNTEYSQLIYEQEMCLESKPKKSISNSDIELAKQHFYFKLDSSNISEEIKKKIEFLVIKAHLVLPSVPKNSIYLLLTDITLDHIIEAFETWPEPKIIDKMAQLYKEINEKYEVH
jgi:sulfatase maturation enzyme AslB (radical SAM superfamily)